MTHHDRAANILVTDYLDGTLVMGTGAEFDADIHHQAGALLRAFHSQTQHCDNDSEARATTKTLAWLDQPHRIDPHTVDALRRILTAYRPRPVKVVPTTATGSRGTGSSTTGPSRSSTSDATISAPHSATSAGSQRGNGAMIRAWNTPFSTATALTPEIRNSGDLHPPRSDRNRGLGISGRR